MQPSHFITEGSCVKAVFVLKSGQKKWYQGTVQHVHEIKEDYVECDVFYEDDQDLVKHCRFYDHDYKDSDNEDAWCFALSTDRDFGLFNDIFTRLNLVEDQHKKDKKGFSLFGLCFTSLMMMTMYGAAFMQLECAKESSDWCDPLRTMLSQRFFSP